MISLIAYQRAVGKLDDKGIALDAKMAEFKKGEDGLRNKLAAALERVIGSIKKESSPEEKRR